MMTEDSPGTSFLRAITFALGDDRDVGELDTAFVRTLLQFGSETEDNARCVELLGITRLRQPHGRDAVGFGLRGKAVPISDVVNSAEGSPVPDSVVKDFPNVTQDDWDAVLRLTTLVLIALESAERSPG
jgi:hypothetical protein